MIKKIIGKIFGKGKASKQDKEKSPRSNVGKSKSSSSTQGRIRFESESGGVEKSSSDSTQSRPPRRESSRPHSGSGHRARSGEAADRGPRRSPRPHRGDSSSSRSRPPEKRRRPDRDDDQPALIIPTAPVAPAPPVDRDSPFALLGLSDHVLQAIQTQGYTKPTPIQEQAIPRILQGGDLIGSAQTGTGKTGAFSLPLITKLGTHGDLRLLVLTPTRELALQVGESFKEYGMYSDLRMAILYGGVGYGIQNQALESGPDIVVATPGRLLDYLEKREIALDKIQYLVIDEADRMLDMGFIPDVKKIVQKTPDSRQSLLFSATIPPEIQNLSSWVLKNPQQIEVARSFAPAETISHALYPVARDQKFALLMDILEKIDCRSAIIFTKTKVEADLISGRLSSNNHSVTVIHSDRSQRERVEALDGFKSGKFEVLVATDIAARGLDIEGVSHVINYSVPENPEDYVHRIGRTGRAEKVGDALTLFTAEEDLNVMAIEAKIGKKIERVKLDGFKYAYTVLLDPKAPKKRKRR